MNTLTAEMKRSLKELDLGLKGELTITSDMEDLSNSLFFDQVNIDTSAPSGLTKLVLILWFFILIFAESCLKYDAMNNSSSLASEPIIFAGF